MYSENQKIILLVEDEALISMNQKLELEKYGYIVITVSSGEKAVSLMDSENNIQLILMDIDLGKGIDGTEAASRILKKHDIPILFLSSHMESEIVEKTEKITSYGYVVKSSSITVLDSSIKMAFKLFDAEANIKKQMAQLKGIIEFLPDACMAIDNQKQVTIWNKAIERLTGIPASEIIGKGNYSYSIPFYGDARKQLMDLIFDSNDEISSRYPSINREGDTLISETYCNALYNNKGAWVYAKASPLHDHFGNVIGAIEIIRDITQHKQAAAALLENEETLRTVFESSPIGLEIFDKNGIIIKCNNTVLTMFGADPNEVIGKFNLRQDPNYRDEAVWDRLNNGFEVRHEICFDFGKVQYNSTKTGIRYFFIITTPISDVISKNIGFILQIIDITEQRQSEVVMQKSEKMTRALLDGIPESAFLLDLDSTVLAANETTIQRLNCSMEDFVGANVFNFIPQEIRPFRQARIDQVKCSLKPVRFEDERNGKVIDNFISPILDETGKISGIVVVGTDITERKRTENSLRLNEERLRKTARIARVGGWEIDSSDNTLAWTEETFSIYEMAVGVAPSVAEAIQFYHPDDQSLVTDAVQRAIECGQDFDFEARLITAKKNLRWVRAIGTTVFRNAHPVGIQGMVQDITERRHAEEALRLSESRFRNAFDYSAIGMAFVSPEGTWLKVNRQACRIVGYTKDELMSKTFQDITHPDDLETDLSFVLQMLNGDIETYQMEKRYFHKDGHIVWVLLAVSLVRDEQGAPLHFISQIEDITERKRAEQALRQSEYKYRSLIEFSSDVIFCVNEKGEYQFTNQVFASAFGKTPDYFMGKSFLDVYSKEQADIRYALVKKVFDTGEPQSADIVVPLEDKTLFYLAKVNPIKDETGKVILALTNSTNITERRQAEEKIKNLLAEKNIILKEVHHRIKNNMSTINALLALQADSSSETAIKTALYDAQGRIQSMMVLYDKLYHSSDFMDVHIKEYLSSLVDEIISQFPNKIKITIEKNLEDNVIPVQTTFSVGIIINELLTNIMKYAFIGRQEGLIMITSKKTDNHIIISLQDNGVGLPEGVDFNTSTGFGMQLVSMLTEQIQGTINIVRNNGTKFILKFPV